MYEVRVESNFSAAHFLCNYKGKCEKLHGHNYKVFAHVKGECLDEEGMLVDFSVLKKALKKICAALDHTNLNDINFFCKNPSAERIAFFVYKNLLEEMKKEGIDLSKKPQDERNAFLCAVDVFETETNRARYSIDL